MTEIKIEIFKLGYIINLNLDIVSNTINRKSKYIKAKIGDTRQNIGSPDLKGLGYSDKIFEQFPNKKDDIIHIGIINSGIEEDYYTRTLGINKILMSLSQIDEVCEKAKRTREEYVVQTLLTELLWLLYKREKPDSDFKELFHNETRNCIFDFCENKSDKAFKLQTGLIDDMCKGKLIQANIPDRYINDIKNILISIHKPSLIKTFEIGFTKPILSFTIGSILGGLIVNFVTSFLLGELTSFSDYLIGIVLLSIFIIIIIINYFYQVSRYSIKKLE
jgi:hypothetical protein